MTENFFAKLFGEGDSSQDKKPQEAFPADKPNQENEKPNEAFPSSESDVSELNQDQDQNQEENTDGDNDEPISDADREKLVSEFFTKDIVSVGEELDSMKLTYNSHPEYLKKIEELDKFLNDRADNLSEDVQNNSYRSLFVAKKKYINCLVDGAYDNLSLGLAKKMYAKYKDVFSDEEMQELQDKFRLLTEEFMNDLSSIEEQEVDEMLKN